MQKVSYMGNGSTTEFSFNFPYFENSNVVVTKNNQTATGYNIIGNSAGLDADIPYVGGKVVFETAPSALDNITILRSLPLSRIVDYQPTAKIEPTTLNQDLNYLLEVIKDRKDELDDLIEKYQDIADKESTITLLARISAIHDEIVAIDAKITALGDISTLCQNVATNTSDITALKDASNLTTTGKNAISNLSMPSSRYVDLTLDASGTTYTAPADGWIYLSKTAGASGTKIEMRNITCNFRTSSVISVSTGHWLYCSIQASKGDSIEITYTATGTTNTFKFIYANGAS